MTIRPSFSLIHSEVTWYRQSLINILSDFGGLATSILGFAAYAIRGFNTHKYDLAILKNLYREVENTPGSSTISDDSIKNFEETIKAQRALDKSFCSGIFYYAISYLCCCLICCRNRP